MHMGKWVISPVLWMTFHHYPCHKCVLARELSGGNVWMKDLTCARARLCNAAVVSFSIFRMWKNMMQPFHAHKLDTKILVFKSSTHITLMILLRKCIAWCRSYFGSWPRNMCRMCKFIWTSSRDNAKTADAQCATIRFLSLLAIVTQIPTLSVNNPEISTLCYPTDIK